MEYIANAVHVVHAFKWHAFKSHTAELIEFVQSHSEGTTANLVNKSVDDILASGLVLEVFGRSHTASSGDYIVYCPSNKSFYPMNPIIFSEMYLKIPPM